MWWDDYGRCDVCGEKIKDCECFHATRCQWCGEVEVLCRCGQEPDWIVLEEVDRDE